MRSFCAVAVLSLFASSALAYQVTGPLLEVTADKIVVEKNKEKWEIARDKDTKVIGELKKGAKVTVQYRMTATSVEARDTKASAAKESKSSATKDKADSKTAVKAAPTAK